VLAGPVIPVTRPPIPGRRHWCVRGQARFGDSAGIYPGFIDGYGVLILPATGRYLHIPYRALLPWGDPGRVGPAGSPPPVKRSDMAG